MGDVMNTMAPNPIDESTEELYEHAPCGFMSALPDGAIVRVNDTLLAWTGYPRGFLIGKRLRDLLPVPGKVFYETHYDPLLRMQGFVREMALDLVCNDGRLLPVFISSVQHRDEAGRPSIVRTMIFDATERRLYERELMAARRRAEQLAAVVESSADAIIVITPEGKVQTWNAGAEQLFGYSVAEAVGEPVQELIVPPELMDEFEHAIARVRSSHQVQLETVRRHKNGSRLDVSLGLTPHIEPPGELVAISAIIRDITDRRRLESRLRQADQLQSVATLAGGVAHEVNNQMAVVLGFGHYVLQALGSGHPQARDVEAMVAAGGKAAGISRQLLAFSRQLPIVRSEIHLSSLLNGLAPTLTTLLGAERLLVIPTRQAETVVSVDPIQIEQILIQLASNARDATPPGGQVTFVTEDVTLTDADSKRHPGDDVVPGRYVLLSVSDTGAGMDPGTLARAFEPFFTTKPFGQGTGLGLAMVHGIVKQHGGHVWVTSELDRGTTVRVYLPAVEEPDAGRPEPYEREREISDQATI
jgi:PAS domain S-box-containing protein